MIQVTMITKLPIDNTSELGTGLHDIVQMHARFSQLKNLYRQGWIKVRGIKREHAESAADHSFVTAMMTLYIAKEHSPELDALRAAELALLHDLGEVYAGDITPMDVQDDKEKNEDVSFEKVFHDSDARKYFMTLWQEYRAQETAEAKFVHAVDKLEFLLQAELYKKSGYADLNYTDSIERVLAGIDDEFIKKCVLEITAKNL